ncbi:unnamed protein product [Bemisia tabaci]|uniref:UDP-glucuronosyltransferase n=1 Tax=Bemisia tabaci TaxID=7038 RepID=A0A9P0A482_BEMTA|nr:unnamed protein product [Bemisia tabaci]
MDLSSVRWVKAVALLSWVGSLESANILMVTMGGTRSHKIPFLALGQGLVLRNHSVTLVNAFPENSESPDQTRSRPHPRVREITPYGLVMYVRNFTDWDLVGARIRGEDPVPLLDAIRYGYQACKAMLSDTQTQHLLHTRRKFELLIIDGAYPECALGLAHHLKVPFMYINTVGFYTQSLSVAGNPTPYAVTPFFAYPLSDSMSLVQRVHNAALHVACGMLHWIMVRWFLNGVLRTHIHPGTPSAYEISKNVSFILQNGHSSMTYPRPYLPNVAEVACIHCRPSKPLPKNIEDFIQRGGNAGFIYVSMGSSVQTANTPIHLRKLFLSVFSRLPYQVLWKWDDAIANELLPRNVMQSRWFPQQDLLGHEKIRGFVTHGGLLSLFETIYHGVPVVVLPVFCDHDANAEKAVRDGYGYRLELRSLTEHKLLNAISSIVSNPRFLEQAQKRSNLLRDQAETPMDTAIFWTEYVLRHRGAYHLQSPAKDMSVIQYYSIDVLLLMLAALYSIVIIVNRLRRVASKLQNTLSYKLLVKSKIN